MLHVFECYSFITFQTYEIFVLNDLLIFNWYSLIAYCLTCKNCFDYLILPCNTSNLAFQIDTHQSIAFFFYSLANDS